MMALKKDHYSIKADDKKGKRLVSADATGYDGQIRKRGELRQKELRHKWYRIHVRNDTKNKDIGVRHSKFDPSKVGPAKKEKVSLYAVKNTGYEIERVDMKVDALTRNGLALHVSPGFKKGEYTITHANSGLAFYRFSTNRNKAEKALNEVSLMHDWNNKGYLKGDRKYRDKDVSISAIKRIDEIVKGK